jgi:hypothetical protein
MFLITDNLIKKTFLLIFLIKIIKTFFFSIKLIFINDKAGRVTLKIQQDAQNHQ